MSEYHIALCTDMLYLLLLAVEAWALGRLVLIINKLHNLATIQWNMYISFKKKSMVSTLRSHTNKHEKGMGKYSQRKYS